MFPALIGAVVLDLIFAEWPAAIHPVIAMGTFINYFTERYNIGSAARRFWMGLILIVCGAVFFGVPVLIVSYWSARLPLWLQILLMSLMLKPVFSIKALLKAAGQVRIVLNARDLPEARRLTAWHLVSRSTATLDKHGIVSAVIESLTENLTDSIIAPFFFFTLGGLPAAWFYRFCNTADAMIAYHNDTFEHFGKPTALLDDTLNWIPARLAALLLICAAFFVGLDARNAWRAAITQHKRTSSPNAGWTMAAAAGALGITLTKMGHYTLQGGPGLPESAHIESAVRLTLLASLLALLMLGAVTFAR